jgi:imidazolonepropionase-like amidohydrolase
MPSVLFSRCRVFDGRSPELREALDVLVQDGRIAEVSEQPIRTGAARVIGVNGRTLMPGLIDAHWHVVAADVNLTRLDAMPESLRTAHARIYLEEALDRGFTTIRDAGGADFGLALAVERGLIRGPRIFFGGRALSQTGGHGDMRPRQHLDPCCQVGAIGQLADGPDEVRRVVREELRKGAHHIKLMASGGVASPADPIWMLQYSDEEIRAAVDETARRRAYVMAHAHTAEATRRCVELGVRSIEHGTLIDRETAAVVAAHGAFVVPTLVVIMTLWEHGAALGFPPVSMDKLAQVKDAAVGALEILRAAGVKVGFGTDLLGELHTHQSREFLIRAEVLSPYEVLRSATSVNAELLGLPDQLGVVAPGAIADLLVVDGNPLQHLGLLQEQGRHLPVIMKGGELHKMALRSQ